MKCFELSTEFTGYYIRLVLFLSIMSNGLKDGMGGKAPKRLTDACGATFFLLNFPPRHMGV